MSRSNKNLKVVVFTGSSSHSHMVVNYLNEVVDLFDIRIKNDYQNMNENRYKRYGFVKAVGQKLFIKFKKYLKRRTQGRIDEIINEFNLNVSTTTPDLWISNIHDKNLPKIINLQQPDIVVLNCVSIIPQYLMDAVDAPFINMHGGITPLYRGVFGGYWALRDGNKHLIGSTIHKVDAGIDTGAILKHIYFSVTPADNFCSYNALHLAYALKGLQEVFDYYTEHQQLPDPIETDMPSKLRSHPTIYGYLFYRVFKGIK
ncbi:formyltransferase family protein [Rhodohalobacter sulfatireducens]|uniref:phosphoribosylglycinamide formyltransferase 1 n=1 Tax=Rhodohalobacter sulfatireducens TaxID=2911366 RepID=A0ABS9KHI1_9BACT|nr:formyltransferase family protein [Rhodohalobacter sulfatireducens]MCG2590290.1 hypothetical protein [Rhodohalobacter sulfatireducens]